MHLLDGWNAIITAAGYGLCVAFQSVGWYVALRPGRWEARTTTTDCGRHLAAQPMPSARDDEPEPAKDRPYRGRD